MTIPPPPGPIPPVPEPIPPVPEPIPNPEPLPTPDPEPRPQMAPAQMAKPPVDEASEDRWAGESPAEATHEERTGEMPGDEERVLADLPPAQEPPD